MNSEATSDHPDLKAVEFVDFPIDGAIKLLRAEGNMLAIHGMDGARSSDFLITPRIQGVRYSGAKPIPLNASGETHILARSRLDGKWSPLAKITLTTSP